MKLKIALQTVSGKAYYLLVKELHRRKLPFLSLVPGKPVPSSIQVVITTKEERRMVDHPTVLVYNPEEDPSAVIDEAYRIIQNKEAYAEVTVGIDPGLYNTLVTEYILENSTVIEDYLASNSTILYDFLSENPSIIYDYLSENSEIVFSYISSNATVIGEYLSENQTVIQEYISANPQIVSDYLSNNIEQIMQFINDRPEIVTQFISENPTLISDYMMKNPEVITQFISDNPEIVSDYLSTHSDVIKNLVLSYASEHSQEILGMAFTFIMSQPMILGGLITVVLIFPLIGLAVEKVNFLSSTRTSSMTKASDGQQTATKK